MAPTGSPAKQRVSRQGARLSRATRSDVAFRMIASRCLVDVATNHPATCGGDEDALHQMRVALTRLRAAVLFFADMVRDAEWTRLKAELKWLNGYLGEARDLDVAVQIAPDEPRLMAARIDSQRRLREALNSDRYRQWFKDMTAWLRRGPWAVSSDHSAMEQRALPVSEHCANKLARWHEKLVRQSQGLQDMGKHRQHQIRLASKRLRYAIEFSEGALPEDDATRWHDIAKRLRKGQQVLGELNDGYVRKELAASLQRSGADAADDDLERFNLLDRKDKERLLQAAKVVYRKIAA